MRDEDYKARESETKAFDNQTIQRPELHMIYELKQRREYLLIELVNIQKAIDAIKILN